MLTIHLITLFPEMVTPYFEHSIIKRAQAAGLVSIVVHQLRDYATGKHRVTDEPPYGGGGGMILKPEPFFRAVEKIRAESLNGSTEIPTILLTPQGRLFNQQTALALSKRSEIILICGRYEGVDERVRTKLVTDEISIGDYVLTGGELGAMVLVDAVTRLLPGALGAQGAAETDSHATGLLEGPHYTRPETFEGDTVPDVLKSGHAAEIARFRREGALRRTWQRRPELLLAADLDENDRRFLAILAAESVSNHQ